MTYDEKDAMHEAFGRLRKAILRIDGPYSAMTEALREMHAVRDAVLGDEVLATCEGCDVLIWESQIDSAARTDDDCWICADCVAKMEAGE